MAVTHTVPVALRRSNDRKVTTKIRRQKSKDNVLVGNTFGLPAGKSCPGRTTFCDSCYADALEKFYPSASNLLERNWEALQACGDDVVAMYWLLSRMLTEFLAEHVKRHGPRLQPIFRIHWDGDLFSDAYTAAWAMVVAEFDHVLFWIYTRSYWWAGHFADLPNIAVYVSVDEYNIEDARTALASWPWLHAAYCADTFADAQVLADKLGRRAAPCPENTGRLPLVVAMSGRRTEAVPVGADAQGACAACRLCVDGKRDVMFAVKKR